MDKKKHSILSSNPGTRSPALCYLLMPLLFSVGGSFTGCATNTQVGVVQHRPPSSQPWTNILDPTMSDITGLMSAVNHLKRPQSTDPEYLCAVPAMLLRTKAEVARKHGLAPQSTYDTVGTDQAFDALQRHCGDYPDWWQQGESGLAETLTLTDESGKALVHARAVLERSSEGSYWELMGHYLLARIYRTMGQPELRDLHSVTALKAARAYYRFDVSTRKRLWDPKRSQPVLTQLAKRFPPSDSIQRGMEQTRVKIWVELIRERMEDLSWQGPEGQDELALLFEELEFSAPALIDAYATLNWVYPETIVRMARAGDVKRSRQLLAVMENKRGSSPVPKPGDVFRGVAFLAAEAMIMEQSGDLQTAAKLWRRWVNERDFDRITGFEGSHKGSMKERNQHSIFIWGAHAPTAQDQRIVGLALERAGQLNLAIEHLELAIQRFEAVRSSFRVGARLSFLRGRMIQAYWGLLRSYVKRYLRDGTESDFLAAVRVARSLTARQFGDRLKLNEKNIVKDLSALGLKPGELLIKIVSTDTGYVLFGISANAHIVELVELDAAQRDNWIGRIKQAISQPRASQDINQPLTQLSHSILLPVSDLLQTATDVVLIVDGKLAGIPLAVLPEPTQPGKLLIETHSLHYTPSLSFFLYQRDSSFPEGDLLLVANPEYGTRETPLAYRGLGAQSYSRAAADFELFSPLPETEEEIDAISSIMGSQATRLTGARAVESWIKKANLLSFEHLHFATHGILGHQLPGIDEPALVLAAESGEDGFLTLSEVETLKLQSRLTVLSACDTGNGEYYSGEGVMGLSRGFLLAGSRAVLVTLWPIDSLATVDFMKAFYRRLHSDGDPHTALQQTQLEFLERILTETGSKRGIRVTGDDHAIPSVADNGAYKWAPFVLVGE